MTLAGPPRFMPLTPLWILWSLIAGAPAVASPPMLLSGVGQFTLLRPLDPAPAAPLAALDGSVRSLGAYRGKVVLLNVWATWCAPCLTEMPALDRLRASSDPNQLAVVTVSIDAGEAAAIAPYLAAHHLTHLTVLLDPGLRLVSRDPARIAAGALPLRGLPISYIIDKTGRVAGYLVGAARWDSPQARGFLDYFVHAAEEPP